MSLSLYLYVDNHLYICGRMVQKSLQIVIKTEPASRLVGHEHDACSMTSLQMQWTVNYLYVRPVMVGKFSK